MHTFLTPEKRDGHQVRRASVYFGRTPKLETFVQPHQMKRHDFREVAATRARCLRRLLHRGLQTGGQVGLLLKRRCNHAPSVRGDAIWMLLTPEKSSQGISSNNPSPWRRENEYFEGDH
jgi:hypothetical protein